MKTKDNPLYGIWQNMKERCRNPNNWAYSYYGGRGISICDAWLIFSNFEKDMGARPPKYTIERIDVNGNYEPSNCKWASRKEQQRNRRCSIFLEVEGIRHSVAELSERSGLKMDTIISRAKHCNTLIELLDPVRRVFKEGLKAGIKASSIARKSRTHCKRGHEYTASNTGSQKGGRYCKKCHAIRESERKLAKKL